MNIRMQPTIKVIDSISEKRNTPPQKNEYFYLLQMISYQAIPAL